MSSYGLTLDPASLAAFVGLSAALLAVLAYAARLDLDRYAITSVGTAPRMQRRQTHNGECSHDDCHGDAVERRVASREYVLFGAPAWRRTVAANRYCEAHASFEFRERDHEPTPDTDAEAVVATDDGLAAAEWEPETNVFQDHADDITTSSTSAFNLFGGMFLVILLAPVVVLLGWIFDVTPGVKAP